MLVRTVGYLGILFAAFVVAVKTNIGVVWRNLRKASTIGTLSVLGTFITVILLTNVLELPGVKRGPFIIVFAMGLSVTRFPNVVLTVDELNIFTSELGQLAVACTLLSDVSGWLWKMIGANVHVPFRVVVSISFFVAFALFFCFIAHPALLYMIQKTPEGKPVKESYIMVIIVGSMVIGFITGLIGSMLFGFLLFGLMIPHGPPLGATLAEKTESFISEVLFPMFFLMTGYNLNFSMLDFKTTVEIVIMLIVVTMVKLISTGLSAHYLFNMPVGHSLLLGLLLCIKGPYDIYMSFQWYRAQEVDGQALAVLIAFEMVLTAVLVPWIDKFYNPHAKVGAWNGEFRMFLLTTPRDFELRVICCICDGDNVPGIISLLQELNPSEASPIQVHAVHLNELSGHAAPEIIPYNKNIIRRVGSMGSYRIMQALENFSDNYDGLVSVRTYSVVATYKSMHEYICQLALQEFIPLVIIPFQLNPHANPSQRSPMLSVNRNMQAYSPCTLGFFVDKGMTRIGQLQKEASIRIAIIFIGGEDDREALALGFRMAGRPNAAVTLIRVVAINDEVECLEDEVDKKQDGGLIEQFRVEYTRKESVTYQELLVENAEQMMHQLRCSEGVYNLIIVGRKQRRTSLMSEDTMLEWSDNPELGVLGDLITSAEFFASVSVLVMQHLGDVHSNVRNQQSEDEAMYLLKEAS
ncbi:hypothetical protein MLD38_002696 [Melastoma candidum]|nr:hypothetical protein MLD38_002696 [Melastoma candidum]